MTSTVDGFGPKKRHKRSGSTSSSEMKNADNAKSNVHVTSDANVNDEKEPIHVNDEFEDDVPMEHKGCCYVPKRIIVTFLLGLGMLLVYAMRTNIGVTVVMILDQSASAKVPSIDAYLNMPRVTWDAHQVGFLHAVFYIGFILTQIPAACTANVIPCNRLYGACILVSALLNMLLPVCIEHGQYELTCAIRACQGLAEGCLYPACYGVLRHWTAPSERSRQVSVVLSCAYLGAIVGFPLAGTIVHYLRWQYLFYVCGTMCVLWWVAWAGLVFEKPSHHATMSDSEFLFLHEAQGQHVIDYENVRVPWRSIVTSPPVWAISLCHFVRHWTLGFMLTNGPLYLSLFGFNIAETGALSSVPHVGKVLMSLVSGLLADGLLNRRILSTTAVRKLLNTIGFGLEALGFLVLTFLTDGVSAIIVLTFAVGFFGLTTSGWSVNHYDLSTRYAGSQVAVTSTFGSLGAIIVPIVTGHFTLKQNLSGWNNVFYLTTAIIILAIVFYLIFGSGETQPWSEPPAHLYLVQKTDPLARKPYTTMRVQKDPKNPEGDDKHTSGATGAGVGYNAATCAVSSDVMRGNDGDLVKPMNQSTGGAGRSSVRDAETGLKALNQKLMNLISPKKKKSDELSETSPIVVNMEGRRSKYLGDEESENWNRNTNADDIGLDHLQADVDLDSNPEVVQQAVDASREGNDEAQSQTVPLNPPDLTHSSHTCTSCEAERQTQNDHHDGSGVAETEQLNESLAPCGEIELPTDTLTEDSSNS